MNKARRNRIFAIAIALIFSCGLPLSGAVNDSGETPITDPHPVLPTHDHWAYVLLLIILLGLFLPAAIIGPLARYLAADELPELHTSEERDSHSATQHEPGHTENR